MGVSSAKSKGYKNCFLLAKDDWDDWFEFETLYYLNYIDPEGESHHIGPVKIGQFNMQQDQKTADVPQEFHSLSVEFFSLGHTEYYLNLNEFEEELRSEVHNALNDIAFNLDLFGKAFRERVTTISLLRGLSVTEVKGQLHRLAKGGAYLTNYNFSFTAPKIKDSHTPAMKLDFKVIPEANPPTNVHVLIGRNGVGKTHLLNNMQQSLLASSKITRFGLFSSDDELLFANLVSVSFSAFDETDPIPERKDKLDELRYSYIGLKRVGEKHPKSPTILKNEFVKSIEECLNTRKNLWQDIVEVLQSDPIFSESNIIDLMTIQDIEEFKERASEIFKKLSSGHKIVLLTITRLIETVEEKTLVLLDEPEGHLHPPLLSAFIRALSMLLTQRNGVAIIATHSPVILQEVPKNCAWTITRSGIDTKVERPLNETFGENVGLLTRDVFGLEVTSSGFHNLIKEVIEKESDITYEDILEEFEEQLGMEARALARTLVSQKKNI